ncbi:hypothetical protein [Spongiimicrobium salis]|uniref:hypothetical protein n=1 Tax=Spongiimicrobium salis TaxID=1667022 RepID=UPI00374CCD32
MKINYFFSLLAIGCLNVAMAQHCAIPSLESGNPLTRIVNTLNANAAASVYKNSTGSPYLTASFESSKIYVDNKLVGTFYTRYNAHRKEIQVKKTTLKEEAYQTLSRDGSVKVVYHDKTLQFASFLNGKGEKQYDYLMTVADGDKYTLYRRVKIKYRKGRKAEDSYERDTQGRFTSVNEYYVRDGKSNLMLELPSKKSDLLKVFKNADKISVAGLVKKGSFKLHRERDLIKLLNLVNTAPVDYAAK